MKLRIFIQDLDETRVSELIIFVDDKTVMGSSYKRQNIQDDLNRLECWV